MKRRIISIMLCIALLVPVICVSGVTASAAQKGDMDGDGAVTVADALCALRIAAKLASATPADIAAGDIDQDGTVTVADALAILRVAAKLVPFGDEEETEKHYLVGSTVKFGRCEQDNNLFNGREPIEWQALDVKDGKVLLVSRYGLTCKEYNTADTDIAWDDSSLRNWIDTEFSDSCFTSGEKPKIELSYISADPNPYYTTDPGNDYESRVFILSIKEAEKYFGSDKERACKPTEYAIAQGAYADPEDGNCSYWLRTPGEARNKASIVSVTGSIMTNGIAADVKMAVFRPALWMSLENYKPLLAAGSTVKMGTYEQDGITSNGREPIEWRVLEVKGNELFLLSEYALFTMKYDKDGRDITWYECSLRNYLNNTFMNEAFTDAEKDKISYTNLLNNNNSVFGTRGGIQCADRIFLLSIDEAEKYPDILKCEYTPELIAKLEDIHMTPDSSEWWLRSPGKETYSAAVVSIDGEIDYQGYWCSFVGGCIRPAMTINIAD